MIVEKPVPNMRSRVMSGYRPHRASSSRPSARHAQQLGSVSDSAETFFEVADLHAFTTAFEHLQQIRDAREDLVLDWLGAGIDPERSTIFLQSAVPEISELHALLSMIVPVSWLQRSAKAREVANATMRDVRRAMRLTD